MRRALVVLAITSMLLAFPASVSANGGGFDQYGYNRTARVFVGPASGWCLEHGWAADCLGVYSNDRLVMKWNAEWDRGNAEGWTDPNGYRAYLDNEWNGAVPGGSGEMEHFKAVWIGACGADRTPVANGGYCIWGQFEAIFDTSKTLGTGGGVDVWAHAAPAGYGSYP